MRSCVPKLGRPALRVTRDRSRHEIVEFILLSPGNQRARIAMFQKTLVALPLAKIRERAFDSTFFSILLIAMAGWIYFIALVLMRLFFWLFL
jgi:hypothetical protein